RRGTTIVLDRRGDETSLGNIECRCHVESANEFSGLHRPIVHARVSITDRDAKPPKGIADLFSDLPSLVAQKALMGGIGVIEGIGVRLVAIGGCMAEHDDVTAALHVGDERGDVDAYRSSALPFRSAHRLRDRTNRSGLRALNVSARGRSCEQHGAERETCPTWRARSVRS